jgi:hypothetical protein
MKQTMTVTRADGKTASYSRTLTWNVTDMPTAGG